jgi:hypothetical protein
MNGTVVNGMLQMTTGSDGTADLGLCRFGTYCLTIFAPWGEQFARQYSLRPGSENVREIVCPAAAPELVDVTFSIDWPHDLKDKDLWLVCSFVSSTRRVGAETWSKSVPGFDFYESTNNTSTQDVLIIKTDGKSAIQRATYRQSGGQPWITGWFDLVAPSRFIEQQQLPVLHNRISTLRVVRSQKEEIMNAGEGFRVLAGAPGQMGWGMGGEMMGGGDFFGNQPQRWDSLSFEPEPGRVNQWKITIPNDFLKQVRQELKLMPDRADAPARGDGSSDDSSN